MQMHRYCIHCDFGEAVEYKELCGNGGNVGRGEFCQGEVLANFISVEKGYKERPDYSTDNFVFNLQDFFNKVV